MLAGFFFLLKKKNYITFFKYSFIAFIIRAHIQFLFYGIRNRNKIKAKKYTKLNFCESNYFSIFFLLWLLCEWEGYYGCDGFVVYMFRLLLE